MRRITTVAIAAAIVCLLPSHASAAPRLSVSSVRQEAGFVEFYLSGQDLPGGSALSQQALSVTAGDQELPVSAHQVAAPGQSTAPKRVVALVLDTSGSMKGAPLAAAKAAATAYLQVLPADVRVAIVTAGSPSANVLLPSSDRSKAKSIVAGLSADGETALYDGVRAASTVIQSGFDMKRIVVLSDGADTASQSSLDDAKKAASGIPVDTIAFHTEEAMASILAGMSGSSGGKAYRAGDADALTSAFSQAAGSFSVQLLVRVTVPPVLEGKRTTLVIKAALATGSVSTDLTLTLVPDTKALTPLIGEVSRGMPVWVELSLVALVFLGLLSIGLLVIAPMSGMAARNRRVAQIDQFTAGPRRAATAGQPESDSPVTQAALQMSQRVMEHVNVEGRMAQQLDRAGLRMRPHEWLLLRLSVLFASVLVLSVLGSPWYFGALLGVVVGWGSTAVYHRLRAARRVNAFAEQLPDALQLIIGSLRSGFSLTQSVDAMTKELGDPLSTEFGRALGETRLGVDIEDALNRVAVRMNSRDLGFTVVAIRVQREIGGNLAEVLATTVATMRERAMLHRQVRALSAEGRISAYVLIALPITVLLYMIAVRGSYLTPLFSSPIGLILAVFGVFELALGTFWMLKVVKVEV